MDYDRVWTEIYGDMQRCGPVHYHLTRIVRRILAGIEYNSVLDVGCGPGHNAPLLTKLGAVPRFDGLDVSGLAIEEAQRRLPGRFWQCDVQAEHQPGTWDLVYCSLVLEHLPDDEAAIANLRRMTGQYLLVTSIAGDFARYKRWDARMGHVRNYRRGELEEKLVAAGFALRQCVYWGFPFYSPFARTLQNFTKAGTGSFNGATRLLAAVLKGLYYLNSSRKGDIVVILAEVPEI